MFPYAIQAKYVRIRPITWHNNIAVRMELTGCDLLVTTISDETTEPESPFTIPTVAVKESRLLETTTTTKPTTPRIVTEPPILVTSTATPPPECSPDK